MMSSSTSGYRPNTIAQTLRSAAHSLLGRSDSPRLDAEVLLGALLEATRSALLLRGEEYLPCGIERAFREAIGRRARGVPVAYLTGVREFWSLPLKVTSDVLVPRPETELLVELALELVSPADSSAAVLDLGTGSGAIALAIASERPRARIVGVDVSEAAVRLARENADALGLGRVDWRIGSWFAAVPDRQFDLILSNPPYVAAGDPALASLGAEPSLALIGGPTGVEQIGRIVGAASARLVPGGWLLIEHGAAQAHEVAALFESCRFCSVRSHRDYSGRPRITRGRRPHWKQTSPNQEPP